MTPVLLPQELVDQVIDVLHDAPSELAVCSLVACTWVPRARSHLFRSISINPRNYAPLSTASDSIIACIRQIKIFRHWMTDTTLNMYERSDEIERLLPHAAVFALVRDIAARTMLDSVHLQTEYLDEFRAAAVESPGLLRITEFVVWTAGWGTQLHDMAGLTGVFPRLRKLAVGGSLPYVEISRPGDDVLQHLQQLVLLMGDVFTTYLAWIERRPPPLRTLCIPQTYEYHHEELGQFIRATHQSLTHLCIGARVLAQLDLSHNTQLRMLSLVFLRTFDRVVYGGLASARALPALSIVALDFSAFRGEPLGDALTRANLTDLDAYLAQLNALREVRVHLAATATAEERARVHAELVTSRERGLLAFLPLYADGTYGVQ